MKNIILENDEATSKLGELISKQLSKIDQSSIEIHLEGDLGAGKTFLTRSIISNSGWSELVKSPTYTLCEEYDLGDLFFLHVDLYRTDELEDIHIFPDEKEKSAWASIALGLVLLWMKGDDIKNALNV